VHSWTHKLKPLQHAHHECYNSGHYIEWHESYYQYIKRAKYRDRERERKRDRPFVSFKRYHFSTQQQRRSAFRHFAEVHPNPQVRNTEIGAPNSRYKYHKKNLRLFVKCAFRRITHQRRTAEVPEHPPSLHVAGDRMYCCVKSENTRHSNALTVSISLLSIWLSVLVHVSICMSCSCLNGKAWTLPKFKKALVIPLNASVFRVSTYEHTVLGTCANDAAVNMWDARTGEARMRFTLEHVHAIGTWNICVYLCVCVCVCVEFLYPLEPVQKFVLVSCALLSECILFQLILARKYEEFLRRATHAATP
jgi:hypothetical protein